MKSNRGEFVISDSGKREDMESGSRRDTNEGKSRPDLVNPLVAKRVGMHYAKGCEKYGMRNFELGQKSSRYLESLERHILEFKIGCRVEDHLAGIVWNAQQLILNEELVERGIYTPAMCDTTDYTDRESFDKTVGDPAMEYNDMLRRKEEARVTTSDPVPESLYGGLEHWPQRLLPAPTPPWEKHIPDCSMCLFYGIPSSRFPCKGCTGISEDKDAIDYFDQDSQETTSGEAAG